MFSALQRGKVWLVCALAAWGHGVWPLTDANAAEAHPPCAALQVGPTRSVTRIIDAETVVLDDGSELRLIGALAPRALDADAQPGQWPAELAAIEELRALLLGRSIELAFGGERADRYGRWQAHVFWLDGDQRRWVQGRMLEQGLARAYTLAGNRACAAELLAAERTAREARRGLWAEAAYQIREASNAVELLRYRSTFQIVEGRVVRVGQGRDAVYLNFSARWRGAFSASLRRGDEVAALGGGSVKALEGKRIRVRGWIEKRDGPTIDLSSAGSIDVLEEGNAAPQTAFRPESYQRGAAGSSSGPPLSGSESGEVDR